MDRIDMSLDDIIKQNRKEKKQKLKKVQSLKAAKTVGRGRGRGRGRGGIRVQTQTRINAFRSKFGKLNRFGGTTNVRGKIRRGRGAWQGGATKTGTSPLNRQTTRPSRGQGQQRKNMAGGRQTKNFNRQNQQLIQAANKRKAQARKNLNQKQKINRQQQFSQRRGLPAVTQVQGNQRGQIRRGQGRGRGRGRGRGGITRNFPDTQTQMKPQRTRGWRGRGRGGKIGRPIGPVPTQIMTVSVSNPMAQGSKPVRINRNTNQDRAEPFYFDCGPIDMNYDPEIQDIITQIKPRFQQDFNLHRLLVNGRQTASSLSDRFTMVHAQPQQGQWSGQRNRPKKVNQSSGRTVVMA